MYNFDNFKVFILFALALMSLAIFGLMPLIIFIIVCLVNYVFNTAFSFTYLQYVALGLILYLIKGAISPIFNITKGNK
ncbi:MAG TPA: hypothetical protein PKY72_05445 [Bacilli bacterium]|nr:hypothetical protein [Bacilli bacterium]